MKNNRKVFGALTLLALLITGCGNPIPPGPLSSSSEGQVDVPYSSSSDGQVDVPFSSSTSSSTSSSGQVDKPTPSSSSSSSSSTAKPNPGHDGESSEIKNYYSQIDTSSANALYTDLKELTSHSKSHSYKDLWSTYKKAYVRSDGKIFDYYSNVTNYTPGSGQCGSYSGEGSCYNREHSIPKSWWGGSESNQGADPFIVVPTDGWVNSVRSNYPFGNVKSVSKASKNNYSVLGSSDGTGGYNGTVFEPHDSVKGDFARIYFYAATKYNAGSWSKSEGSVCFSSSGTYNLTNYSVTLFKQWNELDPVSDWELSVNEAIYDVFGIRNPYINRPEYIDIIWK